MPTAIQHGRFTTLALGLAITAFALSLAMAPVCLLSQEPGQPPETQAPDPAQSAPDASTPAADQATDQQPATGPAQPDAAAPAQDDSAAPPTAQPELPKWPINEKPGQAAVTWDSHGLAIQAANSSLQQILKDISTATGASVEGMNGDERVFGDYGPGQPRDVLSQLLLGAGYNVIMIGDRGQGTPRQILLTSRHSTGDQSGANKGDQANNNNDDDSGDNDAPDEQPAPIQPPVHPGFPGGPPRTPQQMMQERQERLQQMRQQQQQQPNNPQN